jgi:hypothetical protein
MLFRAFFLGMSLMLPLSAAAQAPGLEMRTEPIAIDRTLEHSGAALTVSGLATVAGGLTWFFTPLGWEDYSGFVGGLSLVGLGGLSLVIGLPMWIVGSLRRDILTSNSSIETRTAWVATGGVLLGLGIISAVAGTLVAFGSPNDSESVIGGIIAVPLGITLAAFVGAPMLGDALRF